MKAIEQTIITALLRDMRAAGYQPAAVFDCEQYQMPAENGMVSFEPISAPEQIIRPMTDSEALAAVDSTDESTLHFTHRNAKTWGNRGVLLVLGNGEDVIGDAHAKDDHFVAIIDAICRKFPT